MLIVNTYILFKGTVIVSNTAASDANSNNVGKKVLIKNCASFTKCRGEINDKQVDNANDIDTVIPMYDLIEYDDNYSKTSGSLWQSCKDITAVNNNAYINYLNEPNVTDLFNLKEK